MNIRPYATSRSRIGRRTHYCDCIALERSPQLLRDLFDLEISDGQISRLPTIGRKSLLSGYEEIAADVRQSAVEEMDETSWCENA